MDIVARVDALEAQLFHLSVRTRSAMPPHGSWTQQGWVSSTR
jgi:hypothetical protein